MKARLKKFVVDLAQIFWILPALMVLAGALTAVALVALDRSGLVATSLLTDAFLYNGGATGARTLLAAVASSTIGVAGTVFSITIAALTLAAGQMGPRLLRNFTNDRGNQFTLGAFLGTFAYALIVLSTVRTKAEGEFIPHVALSFGIGLAFVCVGTLIYFVGHMANRINVDTVIELVNGDALTSIRRLTSDSPGIAPPPDAHWQGATPVKTMRGGYLQHIDQNGLARWASEHDTQIRLLVRPGAYVFPDTPIALITNPAEDAQAAIRNATAYGPQRVPSADIEFAIEQLIEVAVRALSPGINDPHTAISVLDRLGATLCNFAPRHLPTGVIAIDNEIRLVIPAVTYDGLLNTMFHEIRQNAAGATAVLVRMIEVFTGVLPAEPDPHRRAGLRRHAELVFEDARRDVHNKRDLADIEHRYDRFIASYRDGNLS
jgi:uncharacterized membrane protein